MQAGSGCGGCRSRGRQILGRVGPQQLQKLPVASSCLLHVLVLNKVDTRTLKVVKLVEFLPTFEFPTPLHEKELREEEEGKKKKLFAFFR